MELIQAYNNKCNKYKKDVIDNFKQSLLSGIYTNATQTEPNIRGQRSEVLIYDGVPYDTRTGVYTGGEYIPASNYVTMNGMAYATGVALRPRVDIFGGIGNFGGAENTVSFPHNLDAVPSACTITPAEPYFDIGEYWVTYDRYNIYVTNTGISRCRFNYIVVR